MKKFTINKLTIFILILVFAFAAFVNSSNASGDKFQPKSTSKTELPVVGSIENFKKIMEEAKKYSQVYVTFSSGAAMKAESAANGAAQDTSKAAAPSNDYSKTNVQVEGVDEADVVKTDGKYIYQVNNGKIVIIKAYPSEDMKIVNSIAFDDKNFSPIEIYADDNYLTVIGSSQNEIRYGIPEKSATNNKIAKPSIYPNPYRGMLKVIVYDIKDKQNIKELRQAEIEGNYVSSRKIGTKLYFVSDKNVDYRILESGGTDVTPIYKDSAISNESKAVGFDNIRYFPDTVYNNYMIIGAMDISNNSPMEVDTYLGASQNIYVSNENLYAAITQYDVKNPGINPSADSTKPQVSVTQSNNTLVYKFSLNNGDIAYKAKGEVPGSILNQFSMDENNSYFRIATTSGQAWRGSGEQSKNNIYILDKDMNLTGKIEDIAPGEKIYSVRFMEDRGYLVTFETVDPLFVVDLKDPKIPKILGALKIPGYSNYLHPYDENHIIGFGKDAVVLPVKDGNGKQVGEQAYYMGMKIAIFDVTNVNSPVEMFEAKIGDRGTDSEMLYNHKALLFSKEKNLLAFPVNLFELREGQNSINSQYNHPEYGTFTFQGAYIYNIDLQKGLTLKGRITHLSSDDYMKSGKQFNGYGAVERILYINNTLYTLSKDKVKASDINTMNNAGEVSIPQP